MIEQLKMVNWKSHVSTEMRFSPATNLLIGTMGSGKTSCLDAICFAFFGTFPSLKSRQVNLADVLMSRPEKKTNGLVEVAFTNSGKHYVVSRTITSKGTEAFLRCDGALLEGPQPIRTTEAVSRILKIDYDTFAKIIYGEQNKLDYFLTLPKGVRKAQLDDIIGISLFEKVRTSATTLVSRLRSEKTSLETFLAGVNVDSLEKELENLRKSLQNALERKTSLESNLFSVLNELENFKKNLESLEELKKINEELSLQLVKTQTEGDSLYSSAVSIMPSSLSMLTREQCTSLLEECARSIQERTDLENQITGLSASMQRLGGEGLVVRQVVEQFPVEKLKMQVEHLSLVSQQLELGSQEFLELTKAETTLLSSISALQSELKEIASEVAQLISKTALLSAFEKDFISIENLEQIVRQNRERVVLSERTKATKEEVVSSLEKSLSLLEREHAVCPTCDQPLASDSLHGLVQQKKNALEAEKTILSEVEQSLASQSLILSQLDSTLSKWVGLLPLSSKLRDLKQREGVILQALSKARGELAAASQLVNASRESMAELKKKTEKLEALRENLLQAEKSAEKLLQIERELNLLKQEFDKKKLALATFDEKQKIEDKLNEARSALKAFELFERTEALKVRASALKDKLSKLQFDENMLSSLREKCSALSSKRDSSQVSLEYVNSEVKEKTELISKLEAQFSKLSGVKKSCADLENNAHQLTIFNNSIVETQAELRTELITAVNEAMHEVWYSIYPYRDYSSCRVVPTEDDYLLEVRASDGWKPVEQCSGGEKTCAALSLRVSLAMVLVPNLSWLVLDEPTHNLDGRGVNLLARALHDTLPSIVRQTFVVTHDETLKEGASGAVHVFQRDKDNGGATVVETLS